MLNKGRDAKQRYKWRLEKRLGCKNFKTMWKTIQSATGEKKEIDWFGEMWGLSPEGIS